MTQYEMMEDYAFRQFDACVEKHAGKIKNALCTIIGHAYNEGYREGQKHPNAVEIEKHPEPWNLIWAAPDGSRKQECRNCGFTHVFIQGHDAQYKFCPQCGEQKQA